MIDAGTCGRSSNSRYAWLRRVQGQLGHLVFAPALPDTNTLSIYTYIHLSLCKCISLYLYPYTYTPPPVPAQVPRDGARGVVEPARWIDTRGSTGDRSMHETKHCELEEKQHRFSETASLTPGRDESEEIGSDLYIGTRGTESDSEDQVKEVV